MFIQTLGFHLSKSLMPHTAPKIVRNIKFLSEALGEYTEFGFCLIGYLHYRAYVYDWCMKLFLHFLCSERFKTLRFSTNISLKQNTMLSIPSSQMFTYFIWYGSPHSSDKLFAFIFFLSWYVRGVLHEKFQLHTFSYTSFFCTSLLKGFSSFSFPYPFCFQHYKPAQML